MFLAGVVGIIAGFIALFTTLWGIAVIFIGVIFVAIAFLDQSSEKKISR